MADTAKSGGVQSVGRVLDLLEIVADAGGEIGLSELAARSGLPLPSIHRLVRTLVQRGYM
jgi:IclR family transcriptional regulator, acetate operon repressor